MNWPNSGIRYCLRAFVILAGLLSPSLAFSEWYAGGYGGVTFADQLRDVQGTGGLIGLSAPDFDLKNSIVYGAKLGNYFRNGAMGVEADISNTTPHVKNLDDIPGFHLRVTSVALNIIARYPGLSVQPYAGLGLAILIAHMGDSQTTRADTDVAPAFNALVGLRVFMTPYLALFTEYKFTQGILRFNDAFAVGGFQAEYRVQHVVAGIGYHF